ncbi:MAG: HAMP domain-containing histidine kinase [Tetragenococcus koreensis]|nr:HAMP domain-containing histidine kinase [Tetragenococcus koreensis]MDN6146129.1 HAMP domain-containing histidine kinase [Tetragenococcus koreensis]MDN6266519.1 HAMP domain-containing histidine kinase [Tetragenococcus koreensis]MDN6579226.1 HAMP domain-containing histidine kinase [Tetragenococcus koreensis]
MIWILFISIGINLLLIIAWIFYRRELKDMILQIKTIKQGNSHTPLKRIGFSKRNRQLVEEVNELIVSFNQTDKENRRMAKQSKEMIASISHDFRTPLTSMIGYIQMLDKTTLSARDLKYLKIIEERTQLISSLIDEFYLLSLLDADDYQIHSEAVNPITLIQEQVAQYYEELSATFEDMEIDLTDELIVIQTSRVDFERIVQNLIKNAFIHGVHYFNIRLEKQEERLRFIFENKLPEKQNIDVERLFDRNYQSEGARGTDSSGLGLAIAKQLSEKLNFSLGAQLQEDLLQFHLDIYLDAWKIRNIENVKDR